MSIINAERAIEGIRPYSVDSRSELAAQRDRVDMAKRGYVSHTAPSPAPYGQGPKDRMISAGFPQEIYDPEASGWPGYDLPEKYIYDTKATNELIAISSTPWEVVRAWLGSRVGHCEGIMNPNGDRIGAGYAANYWTLDYLDGWYAFQTGVEIPWNKYPICPRKPKTNHPPLLRVKTVVRRGKQLTLRVQTNVTQTVKVLIKQPPRVRKLTRRLNGKPVTMRIRAPRKTGGAVVLRYKGANGTDNTFNLFK
ncbi:MAG: CAP domain-containing protein [Solirubrobacterales bacterium]|nr:CAP domain-containing protein [Solirubrobacterales bacterium]